MSIRLQLYKSNHTVFRSQIYFHVLLFERVFGGGGGEECSHSESHSHHTHHTTRPHTHTHTHTLEAPTKLNRRASSPSLLFCLDCKKCILCRVGHDEWWWN
ncbi:hypothetical protein EGW08_021934 [Elysia chlorotica]|uniref:Uncharacterized protein n=1 Tax=Elysia chlorotica TaxID=188477 RepID=A0A3S1AWS4_ELYCH|nr:hypothetical protein EGW08_021934 [Elysia chlorotica]